MISNTLRRRFAHWLGLVTAFACCLAAPAMSAEPARGEVWRIDTRPGVNVPLYATWRADATATVVLFSGGAGGYGKIADDGWPASGNFLIRTGKLWAAHPFNVVMVGRPSDGIDLGDGAVRVGAEHLADNRAILDAIRKRSAAPVWLVGTSMGTISAVATAIANDTGHIAGVVLTSSVTGYRIRGAVPTQDLARIRVPALIVHHARDACHICTPYEARDIAAKLTSAPVRRTEILEGGGGERGDPCGAFHFHGYIGMEQQAVDLIAAWIHQPAH